MDGSPPTTIAVAGAHPAADALSRALRGVPGIETVRADERTDGDVLGLVARDDVDAIAFAPPVGELTSAIKHALLAGRHVLVAAPVALPVRALVSLDEMARRRQRVLTFDDGCAGDPRLAFVRRMTATPQALWRPHYVRSVRTGEEHASIQDVAFSDIACVLGVMGGAPREVSAVSPRVDDESGHADAMMITLTFAGGPVATIVVSAIEPVPQRELIVACDGRTIVFDAYDRRAPLQIHAHGRHAGPVSGHPFRETISEHPAPDTHIEPLRAVAERFVAAVRARDMAVANARDLTATAAVWEAARASAAAGGAFMPVEPGSSRPQLQVITGGGHASGEAARPGLFLVGRGSDLAG